MSEMDHDVKAMLTTLAEAGGIAGMIGVVLLAAIRLIQRNGCTFRLWSCSGAHPVLEMDCEQGRPPSAPTAPSSTA